MKTILSTLAFVATLSLQADPPVAPFNEPGRPAAPAEESDSADRVELELGVRARQDARRGRDVAEGGAGRARELALADMGDQLELQTGLDNKTFAWAAGPGAGGTHPLIVRTSGSSAGTNSTLQEDLTIMSRIVSKTLEREVGRDGHDSAMGIVLSALPGGRRPQSLYLEGYGALLLLNVNFPLVQPPAKEEEKSDRPSDSTWDRTRQELYGPKPGVPRVFDIGPGLEPAAEYDAEQVENLKNELLQSLKYAANIHDLKPDESVTVVVTGRSAAGGMARVKRFVKQNGRNRADVLAAVADPSRGGGHESTLTIRVKKSDADAFAASTINFDEFKKRVSVSAY